LKPRYLQSEASHRDRWTVSYLDVVTILLIFFVAAAAKTLAPSAAQAAQAAQKAPSPQTAAKRAPLEEVEKNLEKSGLDVRREPRGLVISLPQRILFASGDDRVSDSALPAIERIADAIRTIPNPIQLVGHADSTPIHNRRFRDNWELSSARGLRLLELLTDRYGIEESRMSVSSDGANRPRGSNETADGRAENRRVEIVILANFSDVL
jgi:chemotaxis protein MotB